MIMNKTISLDDLPRQVENLLRATWEAHESLVLEHNGKPVAAIVPMDEYRKLHPDADENAFAYELPRHVLEAYHNLLDKKFSAGLTKEEEITLSKLDQQLNDVETAQPLIQSMQKRAAARDKNWMQRFEEVMAKLRELTNLTSQL
ncbi:type II toxin-antitoxin system Phd/YefM family antitoxin [Candidatus Poribacteria bacterium]|nr:type II toxin-antitoxin system Phd/YefM family antitoxin [Candidatus Poribacteria bacterium]